MIQCPLSFAGFSAMPQCLFRNGWCPCPWRRPLLPAGRVLGYSLYSIFLCTVRSIRTELGISHGLEGGGRTPSTLVPTRQVLQDTISPNFNLRNIGASAQPACSFEYDASLSDH
jgi:hypothetical protein